MRIRSTKRDTAVVCASALIVMVIFLAKPTPLMGLMQAASYQEMFAKADLVVIARPISTKDTLERSTLQELGSSNFKFSDGPKLAVVGINTTMETRLVLRGDQGIKNFVLHHYKLADTKVAIVNGPDFIEFSLKQPSVFLMFLIKETDGRYAPASGQVDPRAFSILQLDGPVD